MYLTPCTMRDRFLLLIRELKKKDAVNKKKTGSVEVLSEMDKVYYEVIEMINERKKKSKKEEKKGNKYN